MKLSMIISIIGFSPMGMSGLGIMLVMGFSLVPNPPAIITTSTSIFSNTFFSLNSSSQ